MKKTFLRPCRYRKQLSCYSTFLLVVEAVKNDGTVNRNGAAISVQKVAIGEKFFLS
jgi:hypothetical protein